MSGKFTKKARRKKEKAGKKGSAAWRWVGPCILGAALLLVVLFLLSLTQGEGGQVPEEPSVGTETREETGESLQISGVQTVELDLGRGLLVKEIGKYTGVYMEDGSDEIVTGILMILVENTGDQDVEYGEITLTDDNGGTAFFSVSTLPAGESAVLLEKNRRTYEESVAFTAGTAENVAMYPEALSLCEDKVQIQVVGGALNVTNISGEDISGDIRIYYKNSGADMLYGGITYLARIEGGLKAGELRQVMPAHFSQQGSRILFVTVG